MYGFITHDIKAFFGIRNDGIKAFASTTHSLHGRWLVSPNYCIVRSIYMYWIMHDLVAYVDVLPWNGFWGIFFLLRLAIDISTSNSDWCPFLLIMLRKKKKLARHLRFFGQIIKDAYLKHQKGHHNIQECIKDRKSVLYWRKEQKIKD